MRLARLIDLEVQLHRDEEALRAGRHGDLAARDAALGERVAAAAGTTPAVAARDLPADRPLRRRVLEAWLDQLPGSPERPGDRVARSIATAGSVVALLAGLAGASAAAATLAYDGRTPVNVLWFVVVLVVTQMVALVLLLWAAARAKRGLFGWLAAKLAETTWLGGERRALAGALGARLALHGELERWELFALAQRAACAFNVGALGVTLALVAFTDLAFAWSTTLQVGPAEVHALCRAIAAPWAWLRPEAVPGLELVVESQWVRMPGKFVHGGSLAEAAAASGRWWGFLVLALTAWGLLPRLLALAFGRWRAARAWRALRFDDHRCQALFQRLFPAHAWVGPAPEAVGSPQSERLAAAPRGAARMAAADAETWLLCWGRLGQQVEAVRARLGPVRGALAVGGADLAEDDAARAALAAARARRVLLVLTAGSQPNKEVIDFLRALRADLGPNARLEVALLEQDGTGALRPAADDELPPWYARLAQLADPYLGLVRVEVAT